MEALARESWKSGEGAWVESEGREIVMIFELEWVGVTTNSRH